VLQKALPEHDPTQLDSVQNSFSTAISDFPNLIAHNAILNTTARLLVLK
jgi:hypothetical protein